MHKQLKHIKNPKYFEVSATKFAHLLLNHQTGKLKKASSDKNYS